MEECGLYEIKWGMWNSVGYMEESELYGIEWAIW